jgi:RNA polymerase sigma-70 factor, ECF subfamily
MRRTAIVSRQLIERTKHGDHSAFARLYALYVRRVYTLCFRMTHNAWDAEDLTQEVFAQVYRKIDSFRGEAAFSSWLYRVTSNVVFMHLRKRGVRVVDLAFVSEFEQGTRLTSVPTSIYSPSVFIRITLFKALASLPKGRRTIIILHDIKGLSHTEVGARLGITPSTSKSQLHKARQSLRELIDNSCHVAGAARVRTSGGCEPQ